MQAAEHKPPAPLPGFMNQEQLKKWQADRIAKAEAKRSAAAAEKQANFESTPTDFYTGKPYLEETGTYLFKYRQYDPELSRWTTSDPSGFPDGPNTNKYLSNPTSALDYAGCFALSTTSPSVSNVTDQATGKVHAAAWELLPVGAGASSTEMLKPFMPSNTTLASTALNGNVIVSSFYVQNHSSPQTNSNPNVASVNLSLEFQNAPSGFAWIQIQRVRLPGGEFSAWAIDISSGAGPAYTAGRILADTPAIGVFSPATTNGGDGGERQFYTFAAVRDAGVNTHWTVYDGIFWGGNVYE